MSKWICGECSAICADDAYLRASNPFNPKDEIVGCPKCYAVDSLTAACDAEGCARESTCGTPTPDGYKRLCDDHFRLLPPNAEVTGGPLAARPVD